MRLTFFILFAAALISGCSSQKSFQQKENTFNEAEQLYKNKCGACHALYPKEKYTGVEWNRHLITMEKKAHLDEDESRILHKYLLPDSLATMKN